MYSDSATWIAQLNLKHIIIWVKVEICFYNYKAFWCSVDYGARFSVISSAYGTEESETGQFCPAHFAALPRNVVCGEGTTEIK